MRQRLSVNVPAPDAGWLGTRAGRALPHSFFRMATCGIPASSNTAPSGA
jgi:hypothetical protein